MKLLQAGESYTKKYWEDDLSIMHLRIRIDRFEVLEYWGMCDVSMLEIMV
jgi:hypothetical protein